MATISLCLCLFEMWAPELPQITKTLACGIRHLTGLNIVISEVRTRDSKSKGWCKEQALGFGITRSLGAALGHHRPCIPNYPKESEPKDSVLSRHEG